MKKLTLIAVLLLCPILCLTACNSYRSDVPVNDLTNAILESVSTQGGYTSADTDYVSLEFENAAVIEANVAEWMICASTSSETIDQFGIFCVKDGGDVSAVKKEVENYLLAQQLWLEGILERYSPDEKTKLDNAQVFVYGNYVVFTMLTDADTTAATSTVKTALEK